ncbi:MAG: hypothetical protein HOE62_08840 [Alphaproteobacteria bacterium]|jgi:hypothetical protein|nr:hypothetical protein [Alphaproteobacteria bacterium]MBT4967359.1 hypothetical protein [Alphaproteobacteria bacterium]MBT5160583.1 hypothetical protein [Alphaproteobacteria bacterium]MBT5917964.1 hypothetical protein [Alphaproteobacteria bacterium]
MESNRVVKLASPVAPCFGGRLGWLGPGCLVGAEWLKEGGDRVVGCILWGGDWWPLTAALKFCVAAGHVFARGGGGLA